MSDIRFNQWLHQSGTGGVSQSDGGHVGIGTTNPLLPVGAGNTHILHVGVVTSNSISAGSSITATTFYGSGANLTSLPAQVTIANNADNRVITGGSGTNLVGEANLTYDGSALSIISAANQADGLLIHNTNNSQAHADAAVMISGGDNAAAFLRLENNSQKFEIIKDANHNLLIEDDGTERYRITSAGVHKISQAANTQDGTFYSTVTISSPNGVYQGLRFDRGSVAKWRIGMKNDDTFQIANLFHNGSASAEDNCVRITDNDDINITGNLKISTAGNGISFAATGDGSAMSSELFDDYEEGVYQPTMTGSGGGSHTFVSYTHLAYTKIGRLVHIQGYINTNGGTLSGNLKLSLPFTVSNDASGHSRYPAIGLSWRGHGWSGNTGEITFAPQPNTTYGEFVSVTPAGAHTWMNNTHVNNNYNIRIGGCYITNT